MGIPKRKNNISVYLEKDLTERRQELLDKITKSDTNLPDSILHDDLDMGLLDYVKNNFKVVSEGKTIPVINKILTIQRWGEFSNNWEFVDDDGNMQLPFIAVIRKPDVQPGTNPSIQRTVPDRHQFFYASVPTWNGTQMGADIYKIPQPVPVDISYDVTIICNKFRDLNRFNKKVLQNFSSRQDYTMVKGHYIPIVLDSIDDNSPIDTIDGRRFYSQNYKFTLLGFLIDSEEFEVKPAVSRFFLMNEFIKDNNFVKKYVNRNVDVTISTFVSENNQTMFSVGEIIGVLFSVSVNGQVVTKDVDYFHVAYTSKVTFNSPLPDGSVVTISYYKGKTSSIVDNYGKVLQIARERFIYNGGPVVFTTINELDNIVSLDVNGLIEIETEGYEISGRRQFTLLGFPAIGSTINVIYLY
jgi:hypothetical protein